MASPQKRSKKKTSPSHIGSFTVPGLSIEDGHRVAEILQDRLNALNDVANRSWDDYSLTRATTNEHLGALDVVYDGIISDHRDAQDEVGELDAVTEDLLLGQLAQLELFQWFVRAHLESVTGDLATRDASDEESAAQAASKSASRPG
jgi:starvation-inducible DNA-binding protein